MPHADPTRRHRSSLLRRAGLAALALVAVSPVLVAAPASAGTPLDDAPADLFSHGGDTVSETAGAQPATIGLWNPRAGAKILRFEHVRPVVACFDEDGNEGGLGSVRNVPGKPDGLRKDGSLVTDELGTFHVRVACQNFFTYATSRRDFSYTVSEMVQDWPPSPAPPPYDTQTIASTLTAQVPGGQDAVDGVATPLDVVVTPAKPAPDGLAGAIWLYEGNTRIGWEGVGEDGTRTIMVPPLEEGRHQVKVVYPGTIKVKPSSTVVQLDVKAASAIDAVGGDFEPGEPASVQVQMRGSRSFSGGTVTVFRLEDDGSRTELASQPAQPGRSTIPVGVLSGGGHALVVEFSGTDTVARSATHASISVRPWYAARPDTYRVTADEPFRAEAPGVLANDATEGVPTDRLYADFLEGPKHGNGHIFTNGEVSYEPDPGFVGKDTMIYRTKNFSGSGLFMSKKITVRFVVGEGWVTAKTLQTQRYGSEQWTDVPDGKGVLAGNPARVRYTVKNPTDARTSIGLRVTDPEGERVKGSEVTVELAPGESTTRAVPIDTWKRAYETDGSPRLATWKYAVAVEPADQGETDTEVPVRVDPRPVVAVHGYSSNAGTWSRLGNNLQQHDPRLQAYAVGDKQFDGTMNTGELPATDSFSIRQNATEAAIYIKGVRQATGARHVDVVAHSMGGIITRDYIQALMPDSGDSRPVIGHLVQLGTPNMGSPCADLMKAGEASLGLDGNWPEPATTQLTTFSMAAFNAATRNLKGVELSNQVGTDIPVPCGDLEGDGIVPDWSARWTIPASDRYEQSILHTDMTADAGIAADYVVRRLADAPGTGNGTDTGRRASVAATSTGAEVFASRRITAKDGESAEVEVVVPSGTSIGATTMVRGTTLELRDSSGTLVATSRSDSAVPIVGVSHALAASDTGTTWRLKAVNTSGSSIDVPVTFTVTGGSVTTEVVSAQRYADGSTWVRGRVLGAGAAAAGATASVKVTTATGTAATATLHDDGRHADDRAGDGLFGGAVSGVPETGDRLVLLTGAVPGQGERHALGLVTRGTGDAPVEAPAENAALSAPTSVTTTSGRAASFAVKATGTVSSVHWQTQGRAGWQDVAAATGTTLRLPKVTTAMTGRTYRAVGTVPGRVVTSAVASLTVTRAPSTVQASVGRIGQRHLVAARIGAAMPPTGLVKVMVDGRVVDQVKAALAGGTGYLARWLPALRPGTHRVQVVYSGGTEVLPASAGPIEVRVR